MKTIALFLFVVTVFISSCGKKGTTSTNPPSNDTTYYINSNAGSTWLYHEVDSSSATPQSNDYTVTSTSSDTTINNKKYHIYDYSYGGQEYLNISGHDYYQYDTIPGGFNQVIERLYLKDNAAVNTTWSQNFTVNITVQGFPVTINGTLSNKIVETGISRTVNGISYTGVIHVSSSISAQGIPAADLTSSIDNYYAPKVGLIESSNLINLAYQGMAENVNIKTQLVSSVLK